MSHKGAIMSQKGTMIDINELISLQYYSKNIKFFSHQRVKNSNVGQHSSHIRGKGMDFDEVRVYQPGDDIRLIHWPLTAKLQKPYTKIYKEERERSIYFIVDQSISMRFGTRVCFKNVLAAKLMAILGWSALNEHDQVGGIVFNEFSSTFLRPERNRKTLLKMFKYTTLNSQNPTSNVYDINKALKQILGRINSGSIIILLSDFMSFNSHTKSYLSQLRKSNDIINFFIFDPLESELPESGIYNFVYKKQVISINANDQKHKEIYKKHFQKRRSEIEVFSQKSNMRFIPISTADNAVKVINQGMRYGY